MALITFSSGTNKFDNCPAQNSAPDFHTFLDLVDKDRSPKKGLAYICAALCMGTHYQQPEKYQGLNHWRLKNHGQDRRFLAFDCDGFSSP